jgi:hypothetical protein
MQLARFRAACREETGLGIFPERRDEVADLLQQHDALVRGGLEGQGHAQDVHDPWEGLGHLKVVAHLLA